jgi:hypothetical protein
MIGRLNKKAPTTLRGIYPDPEAALMGLNAAGAIRQSGDLGSD